MKKLTVLLFVGAILASISGCSYFSCDKTSKGTAAPVVSDSAVKTPVSPQPPSAQSQDVIEVQELELDAVEIPADPATNTDTLVIVEATEVDAVGVVPSQSASASPSADQK